MTASQCDTSDSLKFCDADMQACTSPPRPLCAMFMQIVRAWHAAGKWIGDLKPDNVLVGLSRVGGTPTVHLIDLEGVTDVGCTGCKVHEARSVWCCGYACMISAWSEQASPSDLSSIHKFTTPSTHPCTTRRLRSSPRCHPRVARCARHVALSTVPIPHARGLCLSCHLHAANLC